MVRHLLSVGFVFSLILLSGCLLSEEDISEMVLNDILFGDYGNAETKAAAEAHDPDLCKKLSDVTDMETCVMKVAEAMGDVSVCRRITSKVLLDSCFSRLAEKSADPSLCMNIADATSLSVCYKNVAVAKKDIAICEYLLNDVYYYNQCIFGVAKASGTAAHCMKLPQTGSRRDCFMEVAVESGDPEACANLEHNAYLENWGGQIADQCFDRMAAEKNDESLCKRIGDESLRKMCLSDRAASSE